MVFARQFFFFFFVNLVISQSGNDPHEDLAKFGCKLNLKVKIVEHPFSIFEYILGPHMEKC